MSAAGWYPDPDDDALARWWDGSAWTDHTVVIADQDAPPAPPLTAPVARFATEPTRWRPNLRVLLAGGWAVAVIALLIVIVVANGKDGATDAATGGSTTSTSSTTSTTSPFTEATADPADGQPTPIVYSGTSSTTIELAKPDKIAIATISYTGTTNFVVASLADGHRQTGLVVNTVGAYSGTVLINADATVTRGFEVTASGPWTVEIKDVSYVRKFDSSIEGSGDDVVLYDGLSDRAVIRSDGATNFVLRHFSVGGVALIVNQLGPISGTYQWPAGVAFIEVSASGPWSLRIP